MAEWNESQPHGVHIDKTLEERFAPTEASQVLFYN